MHDAGQTIAFLFPRGARHTGIFIFSRQDSKETSRGRSALQVVEFDGRHSKSSCFRPSHSLLGCFARIILESSFSHGYTGKRLLVKSPQLWQHHNGKPGSITVRTAAPEKLDALHASKGNLVGIEKGKQFLQAKSSSAIRITRSGGV